jgi:putative nucleotidyltransferase with HDIG domain
LEKKHPGKLPILMKKKISIDQLKPQMFLVGVDQSWWKTPFLTHHRLIKNMDEVQLLKNADIRAVTIDPTKGLDVEEPAPDDLSGSSSGKQTPELLAGSGEAEPEDMPETESPNYETTHDLAEKSFPPPLEAQDVRHTVVSGKQVYQAAVLAVERIFEGVATGAPIDNPALKHVVKMVLDHINEDPKVLPQLVLVHSLQQIEPHLYSHVVNVSALATMVGVELKLEAHALELIATGGLLHDIGYMRLPRNLFRKRSGHTEEEQVLLKQHSELGVAMLLASCPDCDPEVQRIVLEHHEYQNGTGYPKGLTGDSISCLSDIVALCDCFDSMIGSWGSAPPVSASLALRELYAKAKSGLLTQPPVEQLIKCLGVYPLGSLVELSTGERGVIVGVNAGDMLRPSIKLLMDTQGDPYSSPWVVNLAVPLAGQPNRTIQSLLNPLQEGLDVSPYLHHLCW